jgi:arsenate reductase (thioredoxin)
VQSPSDAKRSEILFLCVHNAGRSQMAAAFARKLGGDRVVVHSAGTAPGEKLNPAVVAVMREKGIDLAGLTPQALTEAMGLDADVIVTMGCGDQCPAYPATRYVDWELADPATLTLEEVRPIRDEIERRVASLLDDLLDGDSPPTK